MPNVFKKVFGKSNELSRQPPVSPNPAVSAGSNSHAVPTPDADPFRVEGDELAQNGDYNEAVVMYNRALKNGPSNTTILLCRSLAYMLSTPPQLHLALQDADATIQINPTHWHGWQQKGEILCRKGDFKGAEEALTNAVGFARGVDKLAAQRSLADARNRRDQWSRAKELPSSSVTSNFPTSQTVLPMRTPPTSIATTPTPNTQYVPQRSVSITLPAASSSGAASATAGSFQALSAVNSTLTTAPPEATPASIATTNATIVSPGSPRLTSMNLPSGTTQITNTPQRMGTTPIARNQNQTTVNRAPATAPAPSPPLTSNDLTAPPHEAPPSYTSNPTSPDPTIRMISQVELNTRLNQLLTSLVVKKKGSLSIKPYIATGYVDAVKLVYVGLTQIQLTNREIGLPVYLHPSYRTMAVNYLSYPGSTFMDMDCESSQYYEGKVPGTVSITGYSEEYREHQLLIAPLLNIALEGTACLPTMPINRIVDRLRRLQLQPSLEDNEGLREFLGLSQLSALQSGFSGTAVRQKQIDSMCLLLTRSLYDAPTRFVDFSKTRHFSNNTLGGATQGTGLRNFLYQILIGVELLIRIRKEPVTTSYAGIITDNISALILLSDLWMQNVTIQGPGGTISLMNTMATTPSIPVLTTPEPFYTLYAVRNQTQAEGLIRFGEAMSWPYMDEARQYIETAYEALTSNRGTIGWDMCDWLFGLVLPGKIFRHRIMSCLVYASPSIRSINSAPHWDSGIVAGSKSYWPKRTVLGRVLGGLRNSRNVCGWIGPIPAPIAGNFRGWIRLSARRVDVPVPVNTSQTSLENLGFEQPCATETSESILASITDPTEWIQPTPPTRAASDRSKSQFKGLDLTEVPPAANVNTILSTLTVKEYRATLQFEINSTITSYTLYSNPVFVAAPPCIGTHIMHRRQAQKYLSNIIKVADLKAATPATDQVIIIDALGEGEEVVARAWCAERGRHAVVRRGATCCFACAASITEKGTGLGVNVLIWSN